MDVHVDMLRVDVGYCGGAWLIHMCTLAGYTPPLTCGAFVHCCAPSECPTSHPVQPICARNVGLHVDILHVDVGYCGGAWLIHMCTLAEYTSPLICGAFVHCCALSVASTINIIQPICAHNLDVYVGCDIYCVGARIACTIHRFTRKICEL